MSIRYVVMRCHSCRWTWQSLIAGPDTDLEPCENCDSADVSIERDYRPDVPAAASADQQENTDAG